jgi:serine/threonine protein kinase
MVSPYSNSILTSKSLNEGNATSNNFHPNDYAAILKLFDFDYSPADNYWQVGEITKIQGWIIHISVVLFQIEDVFKQVLPYLKQTGTPFRIIMNESIADDLLCGNLGVAQIGKILKIYPDDSAAARNTIKHLLHITKSFRGPYIPTDTCLGGVIYTRFGGFNPIIKKNAHDIEEKYIYDIESKLVKDPYSIPFQMPKGIDWPFNEIAQVDAFIPPEKPNKTYKLIELLKVDPKGNVYRGFYLAGLLRVKGCVIKQGIRNMQSDRFGRDVHDRLIWQLELHNELSGDIPLPAIYNFYEEHNCSLLIMEYIKGNSLFNKISEINPYSQIWKDLENEQKIRLLNYCLAILHIIDKMHARGYVHRDINPVNFIIDRNEKVRLIDIELAFSLSKNKPIPPFALGTSGFMSPQQQAQQTPTVCEDIYGLGATFIYVFTGIFPIKLTSKETPALTEILNLIIGDECLSQLISLSVHPTQILRPSLTNLLEAFATYRGKIKSGPNKIDHHASPEKRLILRVEQTLQLALCGLTKPPIVIKDEIWLSKQLTVENYTSRQNKQYGISLGLTEGISGILYTLARIHRCGLSIDICRPQYRKCIDILLQTNYQSSTSQSSGLFRGDAGLALTLTENIRSGLLKDNLEIRKTIDSLLSKQNTRIDLANGIAGVGLSALISRNYLPQDKCTSLLRSIVQDLSLKQKKDGSWSESQTKIKNGTPKIFNIANDESGIIWFLLEYFSIHPSDELKSVILKGIARLIAGRNIHVLKQSFGSTESYEVGDGGKGLIAMLIKAYKILKESSYKEIVISTLKKYPLKISHQNFNQENGLSAVGELYLEAFRVFQDEEWKFRAYWISEVLLGTFVRYENDSGYWIMDQNNPSTADFLIGNTGVIHFLLRCINIDKIGYRLLD